MRGYTQFSFNIQDLLFPHSRKLCKNTPVLIGIFLNAFVASRFRWFASPFLTLKRKRNWPFCSLHGFGGLFKWRFIGPISFQIQKMVISGGHFKPEALKPKEVVSLLLDDAELECKCKCLQGILDYRDAVWNSGQVKRLSPIWWWHMACHHHGVTWCYVTLRDMTRLMVTLGGSRWRLKRLNENYCGSDIWLTWAFFPQFSNAKLKRRPMNRGGEENENEKRQDRLRYVDQQ